MERRHNAFSTRLWVLLSLSMYLASGFAPTCSSPSRIGPLPSPVVDSSTLLRTSLGEEEILPDIDLQIRTLCEEKNFKQAVEILCTTEDGSSELTESSYITVLNSLSGSELFDAPDYAATLLTKARAQSKESSSFQTTAVLYDAVIKVFAKSRRFKAGSRCLEYLNDLWRLHTETNRAEFVPLLSTYENTLLSMSKAKEGRKGAEKTEKLLEVMAEKSKFHPHLYPTTSCVNACIQAWGRSGVTRGAATRAEELLTRMMSLFEKGHEQLRPNTMSFNSVLVVLSKSREPGSAERAEVLLEKMEHFSEQDEGSECKPDEMSYNIVMNCWAQNRRRGSAQRATDILNHIEKRYKEGLSEVRPDVASYSTVINAWARQGADPKATEQAQAIFDRLSSSHNDTTNADTLMFNSLLNCYAKCKTPNGSGKVLEILNELKRKAAEGCYNCEPDVITYTTAIDAIAKEGTLESSEMAESLLAELEDLFATTKKRHLRPNVRTYTAVINAISRSNKRPDRAEDILNRIEEMFLNGEPAVRPDAVCYNAVINAYGWSDNQDKASECFRLLNRMIELPDAPAAAKVVPDIVTFNSVLNACSFQQTQTDDDKQKVMDIAVQTWEIFQSDPSKYGYPDQRTFSQLLYCISRLMPDTEKRDELARATFWECCRLGQVSPHVITSLQHAVSWACFCSVMGTSLQSQEGEKLKFDVTKMPENWTRRARATSRFPGQGRKSITKNKKRSFQMTKVVTRSKLAQQA